MFLVEVVFRHVLLVEDVIVLNARGNRMVLVLHPNGECVGLRMASEIATEELVVETTLRVHGVRVMHGEKAAAIIYEIPHSFLLGVRHPCGLRAAISLRPVTAVA